MTKNFCDLCGAPAADLPSLNVRFPNLKWSGTRCWNNSPNPTEGTWTPYIEGRIVFDMHETSNSSGPFHPDLCLNCIADLLRKMADKIAPLPEPIGSPDENA